MWRNAATEIGSRVAARWPARRLLKRARQTAQNSDQARDEDDYADKQCATYGR